MQQHVTVFPASFSQQRLWFLDQLEPGSVAYNVSNALRLSGPLDFFAMEQSIQEIVKRHESLRTTFTTLEGRPQQVIARSGQANLRVVDLRHLPAAEREPEAERLAAAEARRPFDLARGPLLRTTLLRLADEEHVLLRTTHHIVSDGWSMGIFFRELALLYDAFCTGKPSPLPELPIQYADYAVWQRKWLQGEVLERLLAYWQQQLHGAPELLALPTDRPRPPVQSYRGARRLVRLPKNLTERIRALGRQEGVTLFMTLLAAFQILLYRYTGQHDFLVGSPIANRTRTEIEGLIGFFVNTQVLRADLSGNPTFRETLARVRKVALGAYDHQDLPFEKLVEEIQPERSLSYTPLFQVAFALQNVPRREVKLRGLKTRPFPVESNTTHFDLSLHILDEREEGLIGRFEYSTDLFDASTIERMTGHFQTLLEGIAVDPGQQIMRLPLLSVVERDRLLVEWNDTQTDYPQDKSIHELFEAQVERSPGMPAVVYEDERLTYRELNRKANQLAHHLQALGVSPEVLVGICLERSMEWVVAILGVFKAGGGFLPLDPAMPRERLSFIVEDAQATVVLTQKHLVDVLSGVAATLVFMDMDWPEIGRQPRDNPNSNSLGENLAYVVYTSGSTGRPKGVMIQHRSLCNLATALDSSIYASRSGERFRLSLNSPFFFDASLQRLVMLLYGHTLYIIPEETRKQGETLLGYLRNNRLDGIDCVPAQLKLLLAAGLLDGLGWTPSMVTSGGEAVDETTWRRLIDVREIDFFNMYGPTECTVDSTIGLVRKCNKRPTIGRPLANVRAYVLNQSLEPVPIGVPGELYLGGAGLARGYLSLPGLTAERFLPDPFGGEDGARLYRTGDLVRYLPDGNIEFLGRLDYQVKIRGFRIELGEIEVVLRRHPRVQDAVVLVGDGMHRERSLVAYVVPDGDQAPVPTELRTFLRKKLPSYMIPAAFVMIKSLPLGASGKVDHRALPTPDWSRRDLGQVFVHPRTPLEEMIADIWAETLGVEKIGVKDNFFELGGHSLLATQIISRARQALLVEIPLRALFEAPTVAGLAQAIVTYEPRPGHAETVAAALKTIRDMPTHERRRLLREGGEENDLLGTDSA